MNMNRKKGFTLVEIMIVVGIISLLIVIGVPGYLAHMERTRLVKGGDNLRLINEAISLYDMRYGSEPTSVTQLWPSTALITDKQSFIQKQLTCPTTGVLSIDTSGTVAIASCDVHGTVDDVVASL